MPKVAVILTPGFADWEYALIAGTGVPFYGLDVMFFAPEAGEIRSQGGLNTYVFHQTDEIPAWNPEVTVVIGGFLWATPEAPDLGDLLRTLHGSGATVAGICGGTLALARAGLLDNTPHTSNDADFLAQNAPGYAGSAHYRDSAAAVSANRIITAPGTAPVSFAAEVFASLGIDPEDIAQFRAMLAAEHE